MTTDPPSTPAVSAATTGMVYDVERYATHDGPGTRTTVFLKGCFLRCAWCHNPESLSVRPELMFDAARCVGCLECFAACEITGLGLLDIDGELIGRDQLREYRDDPERRGGRAYDAARCVRCGSCVEACYAAALELVGREMSVDETMELVLADRAFYAGTGGGVTVSGGEPLFQPRFSAALLARCQLAGLHTALDTTAFGHWQPLAALLPHTDLVLLDLKLMDPGLHEAHTGADNASILDNARALAAVMAARPDAASANHGVWVRVPVIVGVNDDDGNLVATARFVREEMAGAVKAVELLGYHRLGGAKLERLGRDNPLGELPPLAPEALVQRAACMEQALAGTGIRVRYR